MALVLNDRVRENSTSQGTGNITHGVASGQGNVTFVVLSEQVTQLTMLYLKKAQTFLK